jgi:hypothetical protein
MQLIFPLDFSCLLDKFNIIVIAYAYYFPTASTDSKVMKGNVFSSMGLRNAINSWVSFCFKELGKECNSNQISPS